MLFVIVFCYFSLLKQDSSDLPDPFVNAFVLPQHVDYEAQDFDVFVRHSIGFVHYSHFTNFLKSFM